MAKYIVQLRAVAKVQGGLLVEAESGEEALRLAETSPLVVWSCPTDIKEIQPYRSFPVDPSVEKIELPR